MSDDISREMTKQISSSISYREKVENCVAHIRSVFPFKPETIIQLGTGLGGFAENLDISHSISYNSLPFFPQSTVESHKGNLLLGYIGKHPVAVLQGRFHFYEGYSTREITFPIRVLSLLGARRLLVTNAAGGLNPLIAPGTIMVIRDHLNFLGENPLRGENIDSWGPRFPDLSEPYSPALAKTTLDVASDFSLKNVITGVYVCVPGPSLETPAETRWLRGCGADAVGMSTVPEAIVAAHSGMEILGLSVVSNVNDPDNFKPILLEDILQTAGEVMPQLELLIKETILRL